MKNIAEIADILNKIPILTSDVAGIQKETASHILDTAANDLTPEQAALLSISRDLQFLLIKLSIIQEKVAEFQNFAESLHTRITAIRKKP